MQEQSTEEATQNLTDLKNIAIWIALMQYASVPVALF